ncbi:MAG TPA: hypothetical protein VK399_10540 [Longimicrobiaceae bacterium]|jgi:hypothetical protein|nr:hypothetical protein [Longimicrobiaceae bacterium]
MRTIRTLLLVAVPVLLAACSSNADSLVDPDSASVRLDGTGLLGTGNSVSPTSADSTSVQRGTGLLGTGN